MTIVRRQITCDYCADSIAVTGPSEQCVKAKAEEAGYKLDEKKKTTSCARCSGAFVSLEEFRALMEAK